MKTTKIEVKDVGPVKRLSIPLPAGGGVVVLRGSQGAGKSTVIRGVSRMLGGRGCDVSSRDGAQRGTVTLGDATLRVSRSRTQTTGELEVSGVESRLDVAALVDPGIADAEAADSKRLKALISLAGVAANPSDFHDVCGGPDDYAELLVDDATDDVLLLAARVKRALETCARKAEGIASSCRARATVMRQEVGEIDLDAPHDDALLAEELAAAVETRLRLRQQAETAAKTRAAREVAKTQLAALEQAAESAPQLRDEAADADAHKVAVDSEIESIRKRLAILEAESQRWAMATSELRSRAAKADRDAGLRAALDKTLAESVVESPSPNAVADAESAVESASAAVARGAEIRQALKKLAAAEEDAAESRLEAQRAVAFRDRAAAVDARLSDMLPAGCPLRCEGGRLVVETDRSKSELFAELSHGERWKIAIDFAATQLGPNGLLTIPQEAWASLAPENQRLVARLAADRGIVVLTADVDDGALRAEVLA